LTRSRATRFNLGVTPHIELSKLTETEKDALILALLPLVSQLEAAQKRIAALEAQVEALTRPPKTPDNSSKPPSQGQKSNRPQPGDDTPPRKPRPGVGRALHPNPDRVVDATLAACPHCRRAFPAEWQTPQQVYDRIELPPIKPDVTRVRLFGGRCACCGERAIARRRPGWSQAHRSAGRSRRWWCTCTTPTPSGWNGWPP
jgi:transposase